MLAIVQSLILGISSHVLNLKTFWRNCWEQFPEEKKLSVDGSTNKLACCYEIQFFMVVRYRYLLMIWVDSDIVISHKSYRFRRCNICLNVLSIFFPRESTLSIWYPLPNRVVLSWSSIIGVSVSNCVGVTLYINIIIMSLNGSRPLHGAPRTNHSFFLHSCSCSIQHVGQPEKNVEVPHFVIGYCEFEVCTKFSRASFCNTYKPTWKRGIRKVLAAFWILTCKLEIKLENGTRCLRCLKIFGIIDWFSKNYN